MFTPGLRACGYKSASGLGKWLNRDPVGELGFVDLQTPFFAKQWLSLLKPSEIFISANPFNFIHNGPIGFSDRFGLALVAPVEPPPTIPIDPLDGDNGDLCAQIAQDILDALTKLNANPNNINAQINLETSLEAFKAAGCDDTDDKLPCPPTKPRVPWWKRAGSGLLDILDRLGRIPLFIGDPCGPLGDPTLCPGHGPIIA